jgi:hypothetical protein
VRSAQPPMIGGRQNALGGFWEDHTATAYDFTQ